MFEEYNIPSIKLDPVHYGRYTWCGIDTIDPLLSSNTLHTSTIHVKTKLNKRLKGTIYLK